jgi:diguanylate cyclase (GGDEF)-like protein/PAS domain S-box-containing protein
MISILLLAASACALIYQGTKIRRVIKERDHALHALENGSKTLFLKSRYTSMGETVGNIAHQWKQPLNAIGSIHNNIKANLLINGEIPKEKLLHSIETSFQLVQHLAQTIDTFYSFLSYQKSTIFTLNEQLEKVRKITEYSFNNSGISLIYEQDTDPMIEGNANELIHALLNLLFNAKDAFDETKIPNPRITVSVSGDENFCTILVSDNAGGIHFDLPEMVFEWHVTSKENGSGLGLYMSKNIIEKRFGGSITVKNSDFGACFTITLPYSHHAQDSAASDKTEETITQELSRKLFELEQVQEELERWGYIFERVQWGITLHIGTSDSFEMTNNAMSDLYGYSPAEFKKLTLFDLFTSESLDTLLHVQQTMYDQECTVFEALHRRKNGAIFPVSIERIMIKDDEGKILYHITNIWDLSEKKEGEKRLQQALEFNEEVMNAIPDLLFEIDAEGTYKNIWAQNEKLLAAQKEHLLGKNIRDILTHEAVEVSFKTMREVDETGHSLGNLMYIDLPEGGKYFELSASKRKSSGTYIVLSRDVTERKQMESKINKEKDFQNSLLHSIAEAGLGVHVIEEGRYIYTNNIEKAKRYGFDETIAESKPSFLDAIHPEDRPKVLEMHTRRLRGEDVPSTYELGFVRTDGKKIAHNVSVIVIPNTDPIRTIVVTQDISELKKSKKKIEYMESHNPLTGLPNRIFAQAKTEQIMSRAKRYGAKAAFLFLNIDGFKTINNSFGHSTGDLILKAIASRLKECLRESDMLSYLGGDEFLLVLCDINGLENAAKTANKILSKLEKPIELATHTLYTSVSIGIALYPDHGENFETLLQRADTAMHKAKESGKNGYSFYTQQMSDHMIGLYEIQNDLKNALDKNEFILFYQPQIDLTANRVIGVEALIRWNHPQQGMIPPISFIPVAERSGLIVPIGQWVIEEACRQTAIWHKEGKEITVAVNISAVQFKRGNLEEIVKNAIASSRIDPKWLELELTESIMMQDTDNTLQCVKNLKMLGLQLSIDDFGTEYSSLAYLKRFAVDKLKIDQSFVRDIVHDQENAAIVNAIIQMTKSLNLKSIAEGVENEEVLTKLKDFGCDEVQGYYFAKPMEASLFEEYYERFE